MIRVLLFKLNYKNAYDVNQIALAYIKVNDSLINHFQIYYKWKEDQCQRLSKNEEQVRKEKKFSMWKLKL